MRKFQICWSGIAYRSTETCLVQLSAGEVSVRSVVAGAEGPSIFGVSYELRADHEWRTVDVEVKGILNGSDFAVKLKSKANGTWTVNGTEDRALEGCMDVDIAVSPVTNTLPVRRLQLATGASAEIEVVYIDVLNRRVERRRQRYTRVDEFQYKYENVPNDFEAVVVVDEDGFVVDYPQLFRRELRIEVDQ